MTKVYSSKRLALYTRVELEEDKKIYIVKECRKMIPYLGEPDLKGYLITLEVKNDQD